MSCGHACGTSDTEARLRVHDAIAMTLKKVPNRSAVRAVKGGDWHWILCGVRAGLLGLLFVSLGIWIFMGCSLKVFTLQRFSKS